MRDRLNRYASAVASLASRILTNEEGESHWVDSVIRPLVADNLAAWSPLVSRLHTTHGHKRRERPPNPRPTPL